MKRQNDFTRLDPTSAAKNGASSNGLHSKAIVDRQCMFYSLHVSLDETAAADRYVQMHDARELPSNGSKPIRVWKLPIASTLDHELAAGRPFNEGLCVVLSSTRSTLTFTNADEAIIDLTHTDL